MSDLLSPELSAARAAFAAFLDNAPREGRTVALHDSDADGVAAGVVWELGLKRLGYADLARVIPDRERNAWTEANRARVQAARPEALFVLDLGSQTESVIPGVPTCFVDHHRPEGAPHGDTLISAYTWDPIPNTSLLLWELLRPLANVEDLDWIAAIGTLSDLGDQAPFALIEEAKKKYKAKYLREATTLINASRRASHYHPETAARALLAHSDPRALTEATSGDVEELRAARAEVKAAMEDAKKVAPVFSGQVAWLRLNSPCQIHPLIAQIWRTRLPKYIVLAANEGYLPGRVNFSVRSASGINVLEFLRGIELDLPEGEGNYGHGHDQASGGSLPIVHWRRFLEKLGFTIS
ncbi:hypothetical protein CCAX7_007650 [Capsulimonas corticalis]|uniref:Uncharacterized protein n=1 Tax=Capsulimonas corticalis TaxID=2219043 RepID=A0A402D1T1_9BACT|nr:DHH family phosphoesterase [Capsulimonas corticalis]BDI28714.1 hypothetical protein CCAX7_007650 [Capsulimonas corticalis]